jgi:hypothetical protein
MTPKKLQILQHALGADQYGRRPRDSRNHFVTDPECDDGQFCESLVALGLMASHGPQGELTGGMTLYRVTDDGINAMVKESPSPPKLTRSARRYQEWFDSGAADCGVSFGDYLKRSTIK